MNEDDGLERLEGFIKSEFVKVDPINREVIFEYYFKYGNSIARLPIKSYISEYDETHATDGDRQAWIAIHELKLLDKN